MNYHVEIRREAEADLAEAFDWYDARRAGLGHRFLAEARAVFLAIEQNPGRYPFVRDNVRQALLRKFPFKVFYVVGHDEVEVIAILHAKRDPRVWQSRA